MLSPQYVYVGNSAISDFLHPQEFTPMIELPETVNPFYADKVKIFAKICGPNVKRIPVKKMISEAIRSGRLRDPDTIVIENSSGNTAIAMAQELHRLGFRNFAAIIPEDIAPGKETPLQLAGVKIIKHRGNGIAMAREYGSRPDHCNLDQYGNKDNPAASREWLAPQIAIQVPDITILCASGGTTGTLCGSAEGLMEILKREITIVGAFCKEKNPVPGARALSGLKEILFDWRSWVPNVMEMERLPSFKASSILSNHGFPAGPTSGLQHWALLTFLAQQKKEGCLDKHRNDKGWVEAVGIFPDSIDKYLSLIQPTFDPEDYGQLHGIVLKDSLPHFV